MTQEEKARAYDEALERAKEFHKSKDGIYVIVAETFFPELAESDDEKKVKGFIDTLRKVSCFAGNEYLGVEIADCIGWFIDWLEKQKECHSDDVLNRTYQNGFEDGFKAGKEVERRNSSDNDFIKPRMQEPWNNEKQKEQKPETRDADDLQLLGFIYDLLNEIEWKDDWAMSKEECLRRLNNYRPQKPVEWSEEDKMNLNGCICSLHQYGYMTYADFLRHLPERFNLQPKQEWSEEDENALKYLHELIGFWYTEKFMDAQTAADMREWVNKSLRPRPQWKPSEEQMEALLNTLHPDDPYYCDLQSLYNDLKKL